jgi:hypothetical protein
MNPPLGRSSGIVRTHTIIVGVLDAVADLAASAGP